MKKFGIGLLLLISMVNPAWAGRIIYPWRSTTAIVKAGESFDVWFIADAGQSVTSVELRGPYNTVTPTMAAPVTGTWVYDPISGNTYNTRITVTVPATAPADRYDLVLNTSTGPVISGGAAKVIKKFKDDYYILHMSDVHRWQGGYDAEQLMRKVSAVIDIANIIDPEMIIETGDNYYAWTGNDVQTALRADMIFDGMPSLGIKGEHDAFAATFMLAGNHDTPSKDIGIDAATIGVPAVADYFNKYFGLQIYNFTYGEGRFLCINDCWGGGAINYTARASEAKAWLDTVGWGNFILAAGHGKDSGMEQTVLRTAPHLDLILAGHQHTAGDNNPYPHASGGVNQYVANSLRESTRFEFNLFKVDAINGTVQPVGDASARVQAIQTVNNSTIISNWVGWIPNLSLAYSQANNGTVRENTVTISNKYNFPLTGARVRFVMPLGSEYDVSSGTIQQAFDGDAVQVVDVSVDLAANSTTAVHIFQSGTISNNAQCISLSVTNVMNPGQTYPVSITIKNTGVDPWQTAAGHSLGSYNPPGNTNWGLSEVSLTGTVATNSETTFTFNVIAPAERGLYDFQWRMNDDLSPNEGWFGELTPNEVITVGAQDFHIEGEDFVVNSGFQTQTTTDDGGGLHTAYATDGDYLTYEMNVTHPGVYSAYFRLSSATAGSKFDLKIGDTVLCSVNEPPTGDWAVWETSPAYRIMLPEGPVTLTILATGNSWNMNWFELIPIGNVPPDFTSSPGQFVEVNSPYTYTVTTSDVENDPVTLSGITIPSWLSFNTNSGVLSGTPAGGNIGPNPVVLRASDTNGYSDQSFTISVSAVGNDAPIITSSPDTGVIENQAYSYTVEAFDADGHSLTYSAPVKPSWLSFNTGTHVLSGTPAPENVGLHRVNLTVSDGAVIVTQQFNVAVFTTPAPANLIQNGSFETGDGTGWYLNEMSVSDSRASDGTFALYVYGTGVDTARGNPRPVPDLSIQPNTDYVVTYDIHYVSGTGNCVIRLNNINNGAHVKSITASPSSDWTPKSAAFNSGANTTLRMERYVDGTPSADFVAYLDNFVLAEAGAVGNTGPVITSIPETRAIQDTAYSYSLLAADADNDTLTFTGVNVPSWCSFNANSGALTGTPAGTNAGSHPVSLSVSDGSHSVTQSFTIAVASAATSGYDAWAATNGITGGPTDDDDHDGLNNFSEYAVREKPAFVQSSNVFHYIYLRRSDDPTLIYTLETSTNLVSNGWTTAGYTVLGTNITGGAYDEVTNTIQSALQNVYIRLNVIQP